MDDKIAEILSLAEQVDKAVEELGRMVMAAKWVDIDEMREARHLVYGMPIVDIRNMTDLQEYLKHALYTERDVNR